MFERQFYLDLVNAEYANELEKPITLADLGQHPRILVNIEGHLKAHPLKNRCLQPLSTSAILRGERGLARTEAGSHYAGQIRGCLQGPQRAAVEADVGFDEHRPKALGHDRGVVWVVDPRSDRTAFLPWNTCTVKMVGSALALSTQRSVPAVQRTV